MTVTQRILAATGRAGLALAGAAAAVALGAVVLLADAPVVEWYYPVWKSTAGSGRPDQTLKFSSSVTSKSIRLIFERIDCSRRVLEAQRKSLVQIVRLRAH